MCVVAQRNAKYSQRRTKTLLPKLATSKRERGDSPFRKIEARKRIRIKMYIRCTCLRKTQCGVANGHTRVSYFLSLPMAFSKAPSRAAMDASPCCMPTPPMGKKVMSLRPTKGREVRIHSG